MSKIKKGTKFFVKNLYDDGDGCVLHEDAEAASQEARDKEIENPVIAWDEFFSIVCDACGEEIETGEGWTLFPKGNSDEWEDALFEDGGAKAGSFHVCDACDREGLVKVIEKIEKELEELRELKKEVTPRRDISQINIQTIIPGVDMFNPEAVEVNRIRYVVSGLYKKDGEK